MRHPRLNRQASTRVSIPLLEGGINTFDGATHIQDKQLIDAKNVWFDGATLRTRPKIKDVTSGGGGNPGIAMLNDLYKEIETVYGKVFVARVAVKVSEPGEVYEPGTFKYKPTIRFVRFDKNTNGYGATIKNAEIDFDFVCKKSELGQKHKVNAWLGNDGYIYTLIGVAITPNDFKFYMLKTDASTLESETILDASYDYDGDSYNFATNKLYAPLLYMNGKGNRYSELPITNETEYPVASAYEGKNLLPSAMRFQFITDGYSDRWTVPVNVDKNCAKVTLNTAGLGFTGIYKCTNANASYNPETAEYTEQEGAPLLISGGSVAPEYDMTNNLEGKSLEFNFTRTDISTWLSDEEYFVTGTLKQITKDEEGKYHEIDYELGTDDNTKYSYNGINGERVRFQLIVSSDSIVSIALLKIKYSNNPTKNSDGTYKETWTYKSTVLPSMISSNIELIAYKNPFEYVEKLLNMNVSALYGGGDGIYGGSRVFLAGCENYFCYSNSAEGKETYFSENNFVRVDNKEPIVALKQMGEALIIFKEKSIYQTVTAYSDSVSASDVQDGKIVDMATTHVYFPISTLNDTIGCDLPNTIKLCLNRLVWATKSGKVYCLVTQSSASQRNIYCISNTIERKFYDEDKNCLLNENAFAVDFKEYYLLFCGNKVWALNYNKDSFRYVYSYTNKTNNASTRYFTWWYWELDENTQFFSGDDKDGVVKLFLEKEEVNASGNHQFFVHKIDEHESEDECDVSIETKIFDFGVPERYKKIEKIFIGVGNDIYADIDLIIHTDKGDIYHRQFSVDNNEQESRFTAEYGDGIRIIPIANKVKRFGIKITGRGVMSIESIGIYYKMLGEVMS